MFCWTSYCPCAEGCGAGVRGLTPCAPAQPVLKLVCAYIHPPTVGGRHLGTRRGERDPRPLSVGVGDGCSRIGDHFQGEVLKRGQDLVFRIFQLGTAAENSACSLMSSCERPFPGKVVFGSVGENIIQTKGNET